MNKIPSPAECGLPEEFDKWRPKQEEALAATIRSTERIETIAAPTGWGKGPFAVAVAMLAAKQNKPTCIVTMSRGLQDQYMEKFKSIGMVDLRGRNNYTCNFNPELTCEGGFAGGCPYKGTHRCKASAAEQRAARSWVVVTNYSKWTSSGHWGQGMEHFKNVIFDEGHDAPNALADAMHVELGPRELEEDIDMPVPYHIEDMGEWKEWAIKSRPLADLEMLVAQQKIKGVQDPKPSWVKRFVHMRNLCRRLNIIATARAKDWIAEQSRTTGAYQFDPIRPGRYAESVLLLNMPKIMFLSATLRPKTMYMLGLGKDKFTFKEYDSDFDPRRGPIYWVPTMRVDKYAKDLSKLWLRLDQIAARRRGRKGIVHTISYDRRDSIMATSRFSNSMIINQKGEPPTAMVQVFKKSMKGTILVSPSVGTGYDFPGDECRWQFICKVPFEPPSKIQKARQEDDNEYVGYRAMQYLMQAFGRDIRSKEDWSERFIADDHMGWFITRFGHLAPRSFHAAFQRVDVLPQPLEV